jgi:aminoglycoside phosphotransferase family enzyme/predicted kinase
MIVEDQSETIAFLRQTASEPSRAETAETFETHISIVFLAGRRALKLKRAVRLPYVDLSTAGRRLAMAEREVSLNRRTAPKLYVGFRRVTRENDGRLALDGRGGLVDAVVEMVRFEQDALFDRMALRGALTPALLTRLAGEIARFHREVPPDGGQGGAVNIEAVLGINERSLASTHVFAPEAVASFNAAFREALSRHAPLLDERARAGKVRHCHGDLHLRNICLFEGTPTLFDCLEFNDSMATIDLLYDLAFLLMDLWHRELRNEANLVLNRYLDEADESDGLPLVPFFMALRAAVRAHVTATAAEEASDERTMEARRREAQAYFDLALMLLQPSPAALVAIGGFSGSGKSSVAALVAVAIGPPPGARILSSDRTRKRLFGVAPETRLPQSAYSPEVSERVYGLLAAEAGRVLARGHGVIVDAVLDRGADRAQFAAIANEARVPFAGVWLDAEPGRLVERVAGRRGDPSDATPDVVRAQIDRAAGAGEWARVDANADAPTSAAAALDAFRSLISPRLRP